MRPYSSSRPGIDSGAGSGDGSGPGSGASASAQPRIDTVSSATSSSPLPSPMPAPGAILVPAAARHDAASLRTEPRSARGRAPSPAVSLVPGQPAEQPLVVSPA